MIVLGSFAGGVARGAGDTVAVGVAVLDEDAVGDNGAENG